MVARRQTKFHHKRRRAFVTSKYSTVVFNYVNQIVIICSIYSSLSLLHFSLDISASVQSSFLFYFFFYILFLFHSLGRFLGHRNDFLHWTADRNPYQPPWM